MVDLKSWKLPSLTKPRLLGTSLLDLLEYPVLGQVCRVLQDVLITSFNEQVVGRRMVLNLDQQQLPIRPSMELVLQVKG